MWSGYYICRGHDVQARSGGEINLRVEDGKEKNLAKGIKLQYWTSTAESFKHKRWNERVKKSATTSRTQ